MLGEKWHRDLNLCLCLSQSPAFSLSQQCILELLKGTEEAVPVFKTAPVLKADQAAFWSPQVLEQIFLKNVKIDFLTRHNKD